GGWEVGLRDIARQAACRRSSGSNSIKARTVMGPSASSWQLRDCITPSAGLLGLRPATQSSPRAPGTRGQVSASLPLPCDCLGVATPKYLAALYGRDTR